MSSNAESLQPWSIAVVTSVTVLAAVAVALRLLARYEKGQRLWWDDWMILWSMAWNLIVVGFIFAMVKEGMGLHADVVPLENIVMIAKLLLVAEILYVYNLVWTKISFLLMFYRIFHFPHFKRWAYVIGAFIIAWVICITFLFIFICVPVQKVWNPELPGHCIDQVGTWIANAASTIVSDLAILLLPLPSVWKLQLRKAEKIAITVAFSLGFFVIFASAYRFTVLFSYTSKDPSYTLAPTVGWTAIEMSAGIVSACLPTLKPALTFFARHMGFSGFVSRHFMTMNGSSGTRGSVPSHMRSASGHRDDTSDVDLVHNTGKGDFYRLDDDIGLQASASDPKLRPEHGYSQTVTTRPMRGEVDSWTGDEVPLQGIRIQRDFKQSIS
ncbi:Fc.00g018710.m01.CDS01 [Cosmosporella sp. VM-42]